MIKLYLTKIEWTVWAITSDPESDHDAVAELPDGAMIDLLESCDNAYHDMQALLGQLAKKKERG